MTSSSICLFHNPRYSSNIQRIFNLLRINIIKVKYDLNMIGKQSLCICKLSNDEIIIKDEELIEKQKDFEKMKLNFQKWPEEIDQILKFKIMNTCHSNISIYKLLQLICNISSKIIKTIEKQRKVKSNHHQRNSNLICRHIELSIPPNKIGRLFGRHGHHHKTIMEKTKTRIHFDNVPYSISSPNRCPKFNLDLFQSSDVIKAIVTGDTIEAVENAIKELYELDQITQEEIFQ